MAGERLARILDLLASRDDQESSARLCDVAAAATEMTGAGFLLMSGDVARGSLCSSDAVSALVEDLQFTLGEGPCMDAYNEDGPVLEPDLADPETPRWTAFTPRAVDAGVRAIFGFPVKIGVVKLGSLNLYRDQPGALSDDQHADSLVMADVAARAVIAMQSDASPGELAANLETGANLRFAVHQASGMVSAQLGVSVGEALIRLRAYAFRENRLLDEVADDVVGRRLRFDDSGSDGQQPK
jgi:GAF domain-containing protein